MGFDVRATQAWWNFFHRFSLVYQGSNFDYIVLLALSLLQCDECRIDGTQFFQSIGTHKTPFEKIHILHNYVNRKLNKTIFSLIKCQKVTQDIILTNGKPNWLALSRYYFNLLFAMARYIREDQLNDLREFSAYIYQSFMTTKTEKSLAINFDLKYGTNELELQIYDYHRRFNESLGYHKQSQRTFREVFKEQTKKPRECKSCAKKHKLFLEKHNRTKNLEPPTTLSRSKVREELNQKSTTIKPSTTDLNVNNKINSSTCLSSNTRAIEIGFATVLGFLN